VIRDTRVIAPTMLVLFRMVRLMAGRTIPEGGPEIP
jgi:hypothetical protein